MSDINYININENFPIAGEDNDTQVFRDNFNTIKQSLQTAKTEVGDLQTQTAKLIGDNDFSLNTIENAATKNIREHFIVVTINDEDTRIDLNYADGAYQVITVKQLGILGTDYSNPIPFSLNDFPDSTNAQEKFVGKMTLELYSEDDSPKVVTVPVGDGSGTLTIKKNFGPSNDSSDFWHVDGSGNVMFIVESATDPIIIEIWRRGDIVFLNYVGEFY